MGSMERPIGRPKNGVSNPKEITSGISRRATSRAEKPIIKSTALVSTGVKVPDVSRRGSAVTQAENIKTEKAYQKSRALREHVHMVRALDEKGKEAERVFLEHYGKPWSYYNSGVTLVADWEHSLEHTFQPHLPHGSFNELLQKRKEKNGNVFCLDVMGQGGFSDVFDVDGDVGVTLQDFRDDSLRDIQAQRGRILIAGNVISGSTWKKVSEYIESHDPRIDKGFDVITCRPLGGWSYVHPTLYESNKKQTLLSDDPEFIMQSALVRRMIRQLNPDGGELFIQEPNFDYDAVDFDKSLQDPHYNLKISRGFGGLHVVRNKIV